MFFVTRALLLSRISLCEGSGQSNSLAILTKPFSLTIYYIACYTDGSMIESKCDASYVIMTNSNNTLLLGVSLRLSD